MTLRAVLVVFLAGVLFGMTVDIVILQVLGVGRIEDWLLVVGGVAMSLGAVALVWYGYVDPEPNAPTWNPPRQAHRRKR